MHHLTIDPNVPPVVHPPRKVPFALCDKLKTELNRMISLGIILPVTEPTEWVNSVVIVEKPNSTLHLCLDPRNLNQAIKRQHNKLPTAEEDVANMHNAKVFIKHDASNGFWKCPVDEESSGLLIFNTPFGRYRFTCLPFGFTVPVKFSI